MDEKNWNPAWKAIGYTGPNPDHVAGGGEDHAGDHRLHHRFQRLPATMNLTGAVLNRCLIRMDSPRDALTSALAGVGISVAPARPRVSGDHRRSPLKIRCDVVVVGSGSGGGVVAGVLAKAGYKVLVLEKGDYHPRSELPLPEGAAMDRMYEGGGLLSTADLSVVILSGSTVGGGSTVNWSAALRTPEHVMEEWRREHGVELFGSDAYEQGLKAVCERIGVQADVHVEGLNNAVLRRGCAELGFPVSNIPRNSPPDHYCGWCCFGCRDGKKKGTCDTWIADVAESGNGAVLPGCHVIKVLHGRKQRNRRPVAKGVVFEFIQSNHKGHVAETCVVESRVTIVAGGALNTPVLLRRSGLKNKHIGRNLHLHPVVMAWGYFPENSPRSVEFDLEYAGKTSFEGGIMTAMSTVEAASGVMIQTPALHPGMFSAATPWVSGVDFKNRLAFFSRTAHVFALARDSGSGEVAVDGSVSYRVDPRDEARLKLGMEKVLRIMAAAGAAEIGTHHVLGSKLDVAIASAREFERFVTDESDRVAGSRLRTVVCSAHQMGSCRMGVGPDTSAVDQRGETWEVEGLYVADSSVFPTALGVNPMVTVQAIAYCTAHSVLDVLRRKMKITN